MAFRTSGFGSFRQPYSSHIDVQRVIDTSKKARNSSCDVTKWSQLKSKIENLLGHLTNLNQLGISESTNLEKNALYSKLNSLFVSVKKSLSMSKWYSLDALWGVYYHKEIYSVSSAKGRVMPRNFSGSSLFDTQDQILDQYITFYVEVNALRARCPQDGLLDINPLNQTISYLKEKKLKSY